MFCEKCGSSLSGGQRFCPNCGLKVPVYCQQCGRRAGEDDRYCMDCGATLEPSGIPGAGPMEQKLPEKVESSRVEYDRYRNMLVEKSRTEKVMLAVTVGGIIFLSVLYYINNPGEDQLLETVLLSGLIAGVLLAVYGIIAGNMGVYEANKYLKQYDTIRNTAGEKEAVLFIEREYHPEERGKGMAVNGMKMTAGGAKAAGVCFVGCLQAITGFAASIIAVILAMAFC